MGESDRKSSGTDEERRDTDVQLASDATGLRLYSHVSKYSWQRFWLHLDVRSTLARDKLAAALVHEHSIGTFFNFLPVPVGCGILLYFHAPHEPYWPILTAVLLGCMGLVYRTTSFGVRHVLLIVAVLMLSGMLAAKFKTSLSGTPILERQVTGQLTGTIVDLSFNRRGAARYLLEVRGFDGIDLVDLPKRVRVSASSGKKVFNPGVTLTGLARLQPVSGPVYPGGYDFSFFAWFQQMGASGFFMGAPELMGQSKESGLKTTIEIKINTLRRRIAERIQAVLPDHQGKIATALVIGDRTGIPEAMQETLRQTGLAHILAISGLHMALVTLTTIWMVRLGMVFLPGLAIHYPIRKWAALIGFLMATLYLALSGGGVATQRAWVMISVMLLSVILDRKAITMRSVAISAMLILLLDPASLLAPGFQMSFAAVSALVGVYEWLNRRRFDAYRRRNKQLFMRNDSLWSGVLIFFGSTVVTSFVAGSATAYIAAWHFHQVPPLGLLANILVMPLVTLFVMPFVLFSILLIPFGYEGVALYPVSWGIEWIMKIAVWVQGLTPPIITGIQPTHGLLVFTCGFVVMVVLKTRLRLLGLIPLTLIPFLYRPPVLPDILVAENGRAIALRNSDKTLEILFPKRENFVTRVWGKAFGDGELERIKLQAEMCDKERCIVATRGGKLHVVYAPDLLQDSCGRADILIAPRLWWVNCRGTSKPLLVLKRGDFEAYGSHAIYMKNRSGDMPVSIRKDDIDNNALSAPDLLANIHVETAFPKPTRPWQRRIVSLPGKGIKRAAKKTTPQ